MNIPSLRFDNVVAYCEELKNFGPGDAIVLDAQNVPIIIHGLVNPLSEKDLKKAAKKLSQIFIDISLQLPPGQGDSCLKCEMQALEKLEQFYEKEPRVEEKLRAGREKLNKIFQFPNTKKIDPAVISIYNRRAERGFPKAQCALGFIYLSDEYRAQYEEKGVELFKSAAAVGFSKALLSLAAYYGRAQDEKSQTLQLHYLHLASDAGETEAQLALGCRYKSGKGVERDTKRALELFERAAEKKDKQAQYQLGLFYLRGTDIEKNEEKALELLNASAEQEFGPAQYELAALLAESSGHEAKIRSLLERAVENGCLSAYAFLGRCYAYGQFGVELNPQKGVELLQFAADKGEVNGLYELGMCYLRGIGVARNKTMSLKYLQDAADHGYSEAMHVVSTIFFNEGNVTKGHEYMKKAARHKHLTSQFMLARLYHKGQVIEKNEKLAFHYYKLAADQGMPEAHYGLGILFESNTDTARAVNCYTISARLGCQLAIASLSQFGISYEPGKDRFVQAAQ